MCLHISICAGMCTDARDDSVFSKNFPLYISRLNLELTIQLVRSAFLLWNPELCLPHTGITGRLVLPLSLLLGAWYWIQALVLMLVRQEFYPPHHLSSP